MLFDQHPTRPAAASEGLNLLPPPELNFPLWRSLLTNLRDFVLPERLPPLHITSRPVDIGMLVGDILSVPWYRTILSSIGDVISPQMLPALQLESQPVDVELISDLPEWWQSLLRNLADVLAPERLPALNLTSRPINPEMASDVLIAPRWSSLIASPSNGTPKLFLPDRWNASTDRPLPKAAPLRTSLVQLPPLDAPAPNPFENKLVLQLQRSIRYSRIREIVWVTLAIAEITALLLVRVIQH